MDYPIKHYSINYASNLALVFIFFAGVVYLSFWSSSLTNFPILFSSQNKELQFQLLPNSPAIEEEAEAAPLARDELEAALSKASMENNNNNNNKTVIIAVINRAYADQDIYMKADTTMLDIFLDSFWLGENTRALRDHLLLVAVDQTAYDRCRFLKLNCYRLETDGVDFRGEKLYMSADFVKMMWRRTLFLSEVLKRGYSFIFTDMDVVWLRDPFQRLISKNETEDLQISSDIYLGNPWDEKHLINTGFYHVRSNNKTIALFDKWYSLKDNSTGQKEQDVLLGLIRGGVIGQLGLQAASNFNASQDELETALVKASPENKTVIIAVINKAYAEQNIDNETTMLDLFLDSFWLGEETRSLLDHLLLVTVDQTAYDRCRFLRLNCYKLNTDGVDFMGEKVYMSEEFIKMMWTRTWFLLEVLKRGYNFIFTDTDVMWLRNPFEKLSKNDTEDLQISTDRYLGNPWNSKHMINTGFYFIRSNNKTIALFDKWYSMKDNSTGLKEQDVLLGLLQDGIIGQLGLKVRFLDTKFFSGFCQDSKDFREVTTVHANCCRSIKAKLSDLSVVLRDWKNFTMFNKRGEALNETTTFQWTRHWGCLNSWGIANN